MHQSIINVGKLKIAAIKISTLCMYCPFLVADFLAASYGFDSEG
jgi:hypothetical protein